MNERIQGQPLNGIKIDVEGHEEVVVQELVKYDFLSEQWIFCEIDESGLAENIYRLLRKEGFNRFEHLGNHPTHYDMMMRR